MKTCPYCSVTQPEENFEVAAVIKGKTYRRLKCRDCKKETQAVRRAKLRNWFDSYKSTLKCERCGLADYRTLEFHHEDMTKKDFNIADMVQKGFSIETMKKEISKCRVLCANCHRIEHYK
jgi:hypothetical protein